MTHHYDDIQFRVWPDHTVQAVEDGPPHEHKSDDFEVVWAHDEDEALRKSCNGPSVDFSKPATP